MAVPRLAALRDLCDEHDLHLLTDVDDYGGTVFQLGVPEDLDAGIRGSYLPGPWFATEEALYYWLRGEEGRTALETFRS